MRDWLLTRHFLRRLLDNDLVSPDTDRHQALAVTMSGLITAGIFVAAGPSSKYLLRPLQSSGWTSLISLDDLFLFCGLSMIVEALVAVAVWDGLTLDARDTAILGWLPVPRRRLALAQLGAITVFAAAFAVALNLAPAIGAPLVRVSHLALRWFDPLALMASQALVTVLAGVFGFTTVFAVREVVRALSGPSLFARLSSIVQGLLVVALASSLFSLPNLSYRVVHRWIERGTEWRLPPLWFAGLHDAIAGDVLARVPATMPPRDAPAYEPLVQSERALAARYVGARPALHELGTFSLSALGLVLLVAGAAWTWNSRRLPAPLAVSTAAPGSARRAVARTLARAVTQPTARAALFLGLQTVTRSAPHRVAIAAACGGALAVGSSMLHGLEASATLSPDSLPLGVLAAQTVVLIIVLAGFRHASRIPAYVPASTTVLLTWLGHRREFVTGVKCAALLGFGVPTIVVLLPVHVMLLGSELALAHAGAGLVVAFVLVEILFAGSGLPFVSRYEGTGNVIGMAPFYVVGTFAVAYVVAWTEREALADTATIIAWFVTAALGALALSLVLRHRPALEMSLEQPDR